MRHYAAFGLVAALMAGAGLIFFTMAHTAEAQTGVLNYIPPMDDRLADPAAEPVQVTLPYQYGTVPLNSGGYQNVYPFTWQRVEDALFYHVQIFIPPVTKKDAPEVILAGPRIIDYIYKPDDIEDAQLRDPNLQVDVGLLEPRFWHMVLVTPYGGTPEYYAAYPDFRYRPTDLGINSGWYVPLTPTSAPRYFFVTIAAGDPPIPALPDLSIFPKLEAESVLFITPTPTPQGGLTLESMNYWQYLR